MANVTLVWSMECGKGQVLGFTTEAIGFALALESKILMKLVFMLSQRLRQTSAKLVNYIEQ